MRTLATLLLLVFVYGVNDNGFNFIGQCNKINKKKAVYYCDNKAMDISAFPTIYITLDEVTKINENKKLKEVRF